MASAGQAIESPPPRRRGFTAFQGLAALVCSGIFLGVLAGLINVLAGRATAPEPLGKWPIAVHLALLMTTLALTVAQLLLPEGDRRHRQLGYAWCGVLLAGMAVSFGIHQINPDGGWSIPHWHSLVSLAFVPLIAWLGLTRRRRAHKIVVLFYVWYFIIIAGVLTFLGDERVIAQLWARMF